MISVEYSLRLAGLTTGLLDRA